MRERHRFPAPTWADPLVDLQCPRAGAYHFQREYDQGGNRTWKVDLTNDPAEVIEVRYEYDINDVETYGTKNNRLMVYDTYDITGGASTPLSTTWYYYNASGNVTRIVTSVEGSDDYSATLFGYAAKGQRGSERI